MFLIQPRVDVLHNASSVTNSSLPDDNFRWSSAFSNFVDSILKVAYGEGGATNATKNPPVKEEAQDNQQKSINVKECVKSINFDHSYLAPHGSPRACGQYLQEDQPESINDDEENKNEENQWKPVREVKPQFILGSNLLNISSFDVACVEELYPDGSPVDKMHVYSPCGVHSHFDGCCAMCLYMRSVPRGLSNSTHLRSIGNKVNYTPQAKNQKKNAQKSLDDVSENGENVDQKRIMKLIDDLGKKKRSKEPLTCEICKSQFTAVATLKNHYRSHGNIKLYSCPLCESSFTRRFGLRYHMQIHNNKYRYTCSECSRKFRHTTHYKAHCRDHSSAKPLQCSQCPSSFKNQNTLNRHIKTKHLSIGLEQKP